MVEVLNISLKKNPGWDGVTQKSNWQPANP